MAHPNTRRWEYHHIEKAHKLEEAAYVAEIKNPNSNFWRDQVNELKQPMIDRLGGWDNYVTWVNDNIPEEATFRDTATAMRKYLESQNGQ